MPLISVSPGLLANSTPPFQIIIIFSPLPGSSSEAVSFVSAGAAMIVRMRGLPYDCTEQQIVSSPPFSLLFSLVKIRQ